MLNSSAEQSYERKKKNYQARKGQEIILEPRTRLSHVGQKLSLGKWAD